MPRQDIHANLKVEVIPRAERGIVAALIAAFVVLAVGFSLGPIFEGPDEFDHYQYVRTLVSTRALPNPLEQGGRQYHQAPLYYLLASPVAILVDDPGFEQVRDRLNPFRGYLFNVPGNDNKNVFLHSRAEQFPYTGSPTALAVHLMRLISVALGAGTMLASYAIFRLLWPDRPDRRLAALGLIALWPQFAYMSSVITNDSLLFLLATLCLWLLLRQLRAGPSWRLALSLGLILGAALLTKINAVFLIFPVGLAFALDRRAWRFAPLVLAAVVVVAGWWYARNFMLYGDPTGAKALFELTQPGEAIAAGELVPAIAIAHLPFAYQTFWARFGDGRVPVGEPIYVFFMLLTVVALAGLIMWLFQQSRQWKSRDRVAIRLGLVVGVFVLAWLALLVYYSSRAVNGAQGRYLLPGVAGWGVLLALGLDSWTPRRVRLPAALSGAAIMGVVALIALFGYFLPAYRPSPAPARIDHALALRYGDAAELIGIEPELTHARSGQTVRITLIWQAIAPTAASLQIYLHTQGSEIVRRDSLPATGNLLSTDWLPGQTWAEEYLVVIPDDAAQQTAYPLVAGLYDPQTQVALPAVDAAGREVTPTVGRIAVSGPLQPFTPDYRFGGIIGLAQPTVTHQGEQVQVCLKWLSLAPAPLDYQVFVHLLYLGDRYAQADLQPKGGLYPTSVWMPGEAIDDCVALDAPGLPASGWQIAVGLYDLATEQRLPVVDVDGRALDNDMILVTPTP